MISIVMAYHNRLNLLDFTLSTIAQTAHMDYEVIIVDDFSEGHENPTLLKEKYKDMNLRIIKMDELYDTKDYTNPCIPYNVGFGQARGDKIIIQNPECCHMGDVLTHTEHNLNDDVYLSFHCYGSKPEDLDKIHKGEPIKYEEVFEPAIPGGGVWYNHKVYSPRSFHFTTAITRNRLSELNGFDERFRDGISYDDIEFFHRIKNLIPVVEYVESPHTIHQYHEKIHGRIPNARQRVQQNLNLYNHVKKDEPNAVHAYNNGKQIIKTR